jgi:hypothetical protein
MNSTQPPPIEEKNIFRLDVLGVLRHFVSSLDAYNP